jgi:hypothetical protein
MLVSGSVPVLVTTTRHHTCEPYTVVDKAAQSAPLIGWVGSQEGPKGKMHTCTTAEMESLAADAGVGVQASSANRGNKSPAVRKARKRGATPPVVLIPPFLGRGRTAEASKCWCRLLEQGGFENVVLT